MRVCHWIMSVFSVSVTVTVTDWVGRPVTGATVNPMITRSGRLLPSRVDQFRESAPAAAAPLHGRPLRKGVSSGAAAAAPLRRRRGSAGRQCDGLSSEATAWLSKSSEAFHGSLPLSAWAGLAIQSCSSSSSVASALTKRGVSKCLK